ncbi:putative nuclear receptor corepressor 1, partial [Operophtera brumata]
PGQTDHGHGGGTLAYGGKPGGVVPPQPRPPPAAPYAPQPMQSEAKDVSYPDYRETIRDSSYARSGGAVGEYRTGSRMSILGTGYLPPPAPAAHHPPPADPPPFKKIRLTAERPPTTSLPTHQPLRVDREMALSDATLSKLRKKQEELEQTASRPAQAAEPEEAATSAHALLAHLGPPILYPLYNQPQDTEREDALAEAYTRRASEWMRRVERIEQGQKRKAKDARNREFFEKREERERFNRLGARVKSEAELEEIADGLHEQEHEDKKMRALTVVPPLLRDPKDPTPIYTDTNRRCMDMESEHKELQLRNVWSQAEREVFRDKYLQHPKNFGQIASFLPRKSAFGAESPPTARGARATGGGHHKAATLPGN